MDNVTAHSEAVDAMLALEGHYDLSADVLARIGALIVGYSAFDTSLERCLWNLELATPEETKTGPFDQKLKLLRERAFPLNYEPWDHFAEVFLAKADALLSYRNTVAHGLPAERGELVRNFYPFNVIRGRRPRTKVSVTVENLNLALSALLRLMTATADILALSATNPIEKVLSSQVVLKHRPLLESIVVPSESEV